MAELKDKIMENGMRLTEQREVILALLRTTTNHPRADEVYEKVRKKLPSISIGTVYRNLHVLVSLGLVNELNDKNSTRFDGITSEHYHFNCEKCNMIIDLDIPINKSLNRMIEKKTGYTVSGHKIEFNGLCDSCLG